MITSVRAAAKRKNALGAFLRDRRAKLDPASFGIPLQRRRTPGLRREEVAQRANVSATWYTWIEQGRGGAPSADVLDRIARALMLTDAEREHLFLIGIGRPPEPRYQPVGSVSPRLQRVLDAFPFSPALIKTPTWDVIAWNRAATVVLTDYAAIEPSQRNILRLMFCAPQVRAAQPNWKSVAKFVVGAFRADVARAGATEEVKALVDELSRLSPEFATLWQDTDIASHGGGAKQINHPKLGLIEMEFSVFAVDGRSDLSMIVYNPATQKVADRIRRFIK
ncbi:MAG: helix-turn-helix transcriptional regulator [Gemmatimonadaceae bacterium]